MTVCNIVHCDRSECDRVGGAYCVNCDNVSEVLLQYVCNMCCNQSECDQVGDVYRVNNCDNVSKVLVLYVILCIATEV